MDTQAEYQQFHFVYIYINLLLNFKDKSSIISFRDIWLNKID